VARNIEIKARVVDPAGLQRRIAALPATGRQELRQVDTFFRVPSGRLKLREFDDGSAELIRYERPDCGEAKLSVYDRVAVPEPTPLRALLTRALGIRGTVRKQRIVVLVGNTRIHLDTVEGLGDFLELEVVLSEDDDIAAGEVIATNLLQQLRIKSEEFVSGAYIDLLERIPI
jgi:predicted adenylyl cyclase CyaB